MCQALLGTFLFILFETRASHIKGPQMMAKKKQLEVRSFQRTSKIGFSLMFVLKDPPPRASAHLQTLLLLGLCSSAPLRCLEG